MHCGAPAGFMTLVCRRCVASPPVAQRDSGEAISGASGRGRIVRYQAHIRANSGYLALRGLIRIAFVVLGIALYGTLIAFVTGAFAAQVDNDMRRPPPSGSLATPLLIAVAVGVVGTFLLYAAHGAAVLLIDMVDATLEQGARKSPRSASQEVTDPGRASTAVSMG